MNSITNNYTSLMADTFSALEVWQKLRAHQQSQSRNIDHGKYTWIREYG